MTEKQRKGKAAILVRVSTAKQTSTDDDCPIPIQLDNCLEYCTKNDIEVIKVIQETKSAYKTDISKREPLQEIMEMAEKGEIDTLVVFKFDRIGRTGATTASFIEDLIAKNVQIYSVSEGRISLDSITEEIMLMIRAITAKSESVGTSVRVTAAMESLVKNGKYRGGPVPIGYKLENTGKVDKKGRVVNNICVDEEEAIWVRAIFDLITNRGYGSFQIARYLNDNGVRTKKGCLFQPNGVLRMLCNRIYIGYMDTKKVKGPYNEHLQIVDEAVFEKAQEILNKRKCKNKEHRDICLSSRGNALLSGNIYCGHCGCRLTYSTSHSTSYLMADGTKKCYPVASKYVCAKRGNRRGCEGQSAYSGQAIDEVITLVVDEILANIKDTPEKIAVETTYEKVIKDLNTERATLASKIKELKEKEVKLVDEVAKSLVGDSEMSFELINTAYTKVKEELKNSQLKLAECEERVKNSTNDKKAIQERYNNLVTWAEEFSNADIARKRMITAEIISRVEISKGYNVKLTISGIYKKLINCSTEEFQKRINSRQSA